MACEEIQDQVRRSLFDVTNVFEKRKVLGDSGGHAFLGTRVVDYLLEAYATENVMAETITDMQNFKKTVKHEAKQVRKSGLYKDLEIQPSVYRTHDQRNIR